MTVSNDNLTNDQSQALDLLSDLIERAEKAGAEAADAIYINGISLTLAQRLGKPEHLERSEGADIGLRVLIGKRQAMVSSSDYSSDALDELCQRAVAMAKVVPEDPYCGLAEPGQLATNIPDLDSCDPDEPSADQLTELAKRAEEAAMAVEGVSNSEGAQASWGMNTVALAASNGFARSYSNSRHSLSASVLAGVGTGMERDYDYASTVYGEDLRSPEDIGRTAGEKAVRRLNPQKTNTAAVPVVFERQVGRTTVPRRDQYHRCAAPQAGFEVPAIRCRRYRDTATQADRQRCPENLDHGFTFGPAIGAGNHRQCRSGNVVAAVTVIKQPVPGSRSGEPD